MFERHLILVTNTQPANYQARGPYGRQIQGGEMVSGNVGQGPSQGFYQFAEQGVQAHQFPQPYGSQQMALAASGEEQMRPATPRLDERASQARYVQFQQVG